MKVLKTLLLSCLSIFFFNCGDDDENRKDASKFNFSASELKQTAWKGEIVSFSEGEITSQGPISIQFSTENEGVCEYKLDYFIRPEIYDFEYKIEDQLIRIRNASLTISGDWILQKYDRDSLVITKNKALTNSNIIKVRRVN